MALPAPHLDSLRILKRISRGTSNSVFDSATNSPQQNKRKQEPPCGLAIRKGVLRCNIATAMQMFRVFTAFLIASVVALAQGPRSITLAYIQLNSANPDVAVAFWKDIIGTTTFSRGSLNGVSTLGIMIAITRNAPSGPSVGSVIDYLGFRVPDLQPYIDKLAKTSYKSSQPKSDSEVLMIDGPDGVQVELTADNSMYASLEFSHIHFHTAKPDETQAWYAEHFGAKPNTEDQLHSSRLGATTLTFSQGDSALPTAGRAIDHLTLEVKDLQNFRDALAAKGVKMDPPSSSNPHTVFLTDPWGTRIELTEAASH